jgi:cytochrome P450
MADVPAHVPPELVRRWRFETAPGAQSDPHAANEPMIGGPDIYYSPIEGTPGLEGNWVVTRTDYIREVYLDPASFSSRGYAGLAAILGEDWNLVPAELDPPEHGKYRAILAPLFGPARIAQLEPKVRRLTAQLIEKVVADKACDFEAQIGRPLPVSIFLELVGLPVQETPKFLQWADDMLHGATVEDVRRGALNVRRYMAQLVEERKRNPRDDILSHFVHSKVDGQPIDEAHLIGFSMLFFGAGLDTVTAQTNFAIRHLAQNQEHQELVRANPSMLPRVVDEMLRAYPAVAIARKVAKDVVFHGVPMKKGDNVMLPAQLSARDPRAWDRPEVVDFNRKTTGHVALGYGAHLCLGMHLGRQEMRVILDEWLKRIPRFRLDPHDPPTISARGVWTFKKLPLLWD